MSKTIMISNETYKKLKEIKEDKSYSETIMELLNHKKSKRVEDLKKFVGILKGDTEYDKIMKEVDKYWKKWTQRYA